MLGFLRRKICPIGIDLGMDNIKLVQLSGSEDAYELLAAARYVADRDCAGDPQQRCTWLAQGLKQALRDKPFKSRQVVLSLPANDMFIEHLRLPPMDDAQVPAAVAQHAHERLEKLGPLLVRHLMVGPVYDNGETKLEVIMMAAPQKQVERYLRLVEQARLEVTGIHVEPAALVQGFSHLLKRDDQQDKATMLLDLGHQGTKVVVTHGGQIVFARNLSMGARHLVEALRRRLKVDVATAATHCRTLGRTPASNPGPARAAVAVADEADEIHAAVGPLLDTLCEDIRGCVRYHDFLFERQPVSRIIFLGGQARNTALCRQLASTIGLPAQLGDPIARVAKESRLGSHSDLEADQANCDWAVAFGLSLS